MSLACRYRVARDDPGTRLGLPEVRLGIHPGFGGSVRMTRLLGGLKAMDLMLSGRSVDGRQAKRIGLVDATAPERHLRAAGRAMLVNESPPARPARMAALSNHGLVRPVLARILRRQVAARVPEQHYPAPYALIDVWKSSAGDPDRMMEAEARSVANLITGSTAQNLVRVFLLQEHLKMLGRDTGFNPRTVHVVGAGVMGGDIAAWCALQGMQVTLQDQSPERIAPAIKRAHALFKRRFKRHRPIQEAMDRLLPDHQGLGVSQADVVIEAIFEDGDAKRNLYRELEPRMKTDAVLATNTSSIPLEELATALSRPERLVGLHFFNPVAKMQLIEVVRGGASNEETVARAMTFTRKIDRLPLPVTSTPGFLVNRILMPYLMEAVVLESEGVPAAVIDKAATDFGMPMGPVELADTVGLDICLHVAEILAGHFNTAIPEKLRRMVADGHLGRKSGQGFYLYKNGKPVKPGSSGQAPGMEEISDRLVLRLLNESVACLREHVVEDADMLDAGMIFGTGFAPFRGGPMHYIHDAGEKSFREKLQKQQKMHGDRFAEDPGWGTATT
jgi:3-hydroxyacyl-CoA dehydrogenase/enoyl-CoA hydratase/3-hydroxybutyryl-CoA epimerase